LKKKILLHHFKKPNASLFITLGPAAVVLATPEYRAASVTAPGPW